MQGTQVQSLVREALHAMGCGPPREFFGFFSIFMKIKKVGEKKVRK